MKAMATPDEVGAAAVPYLRVVGHLVFSYFWARMAKIALEKQNSGDTFYKVKLATARFYFAKLLPETASQIRMARAGGRAIALDAADIGAGSRRLLGLFGSPGGITGGMPPIDASGNDDCHQHCPDERRGLHGLHGL